MVLIQSIAGEEWWEGVTVVMLEAARKKPRALVKLIEKGKRVVVYTDFEDELGEGAAIQLPGVGTVRNLAKFKRTCLLMPATVTAALTRASRSLGLVK